MMNLLIYSLIYLFQAFILWQYCDNLLIAKTPQKTTIPTLLILYLILLGVSSFQFNTLNLIAFFLVNSIFIYALFYTTIPLCIFHGLFLTFLMWGSELLIITIFPAINIGYDMSLANTTNIVILAIISKTLYFLIVRIIVNISPLHNKAITLKTKESLILLAVPISTLFILGTLALTTISFPLTYDIYLLIAFSCILLLLLNILVYSAHYYISNHNKEYMKMELQLQHDKNQVSYYKNLLQYDDEQKIMIHDIKKHLTVIASLNSATKYEEATLYIDKLSNMDSLRPSLRVCDHELLNVILNKYSTQAKSNEIKFHIDIRSNSLLFIANDDLTSLFCNLLDNAFESTLHLAESYIELSVTQSEETLTTTIALINSCEVTPFLPDGKTLITKKPNSHRHGFGIKSIDKIVYQYHGLINRYYQEETLTFHTIILINQVDLSKC